MFVFLIIWITGADFKFICTGMILNAGLIMNMYVENISLTKAFLIMVAYFKHDFMVFIILTILMKNTVFIKQYVTITGSVRLFRKFQRFALTNGAKYFHPIEIPHSFISICGRFPCRIYGINFIPIL